jgi:hypothetical protein
MHDMLELLADHIVNSHHVHDCVFNCPQFSDIWKTSADSRDLVYTNMRPGHWLPELNAQQKFQLSGFPVIGQLYFLPQETKYLNIAKLKLQQRK